MKKIKTSSFHKKCESCPTIVKTLLIGKCKMVLKRSFQRLQLCSSIRVICQSYEPTNVAWFIILNNQEFSNLSWFLKLFAILMWPLLLIKNIYYRKKSGELLPNLSCGVLWIGLPMVIGHHFDSKFQHHLFS